MTADTPRAEPMKPGQFDLVTAISSLDALEALSAGRFAYTAYNSEIAQNVKVLRDQIADADCTIKNLARALREAVEPPTFMGEPVACRLPLAGALKQPDVVNPMAEWPWVTSALAGAAPSDAAVQPVARLLHWNVGTNPSVTTPVARTFTEFPKGEGEKLGGCWDEGEPLYTSPLPTAPAGAREALEKAMVALAASLQMNGPYHGIPAGTSIDGSAILSMQQRYKDDEAKVNAAIKDALESLRAALAAAPLERIALSDEGVRVIKAARVYFDGYVQDEADDLETCVDETHHLAAIELRDSLAAMKEHPQP